MNRKKSILYPFLFLGTLLLALLTALPASAFDRLWVQGFDNPDTTGDSVRKIVGLPDGDFIASGRVGSGATGDIKVFRLNSDGSTQWSRVVDVGGTSDDVNDMVVDTATAEIYLCGRTSVSGQGLMWWAMKLNGSDGSNGWTAPYNYNHGTGNDEPRALALVQDGVVKNLVVVGQIDVSGTQGRLIKLNASTGALLWGQNITSGQMWDVVTDGDGNIYAGGETFSANNQAYLVKYNVGGTQQWYKTYAPHGGSFNRWNHIALDPISNDILTTGLIGGPSGGTSTNDLGLSRYSDTDGTQVWTKLINGPANEGDSGSNIIVDSGGDAYVAGVYRRGASAHPGANVYIARINIGNGNVVWEKDYTGDTGTSGDILDNIQIVGTTLYAAGYLTNTTPGRSALILKLDKADGAEIEKTIFTDRICPQIVGKQGMVVASNGDIIIAGDSGVTTGTGEVHRYGVAAPVATAPTVTTATQSSVTHNSATLGGNVTADGGASVTERGIVWGTSADPTTGNNKVSNGTGTGSFSATVGSLPSSTTVHVRAYAINSAGTAYGSNISFATSAPPAPEIVVEQPAGTNIADAGSKDFGSVTVGNNTSLTFTIKNTGNANLTGLTITKDGTNSGDFTVTADPSAPVSGPSGSTTFTVQFAPGGTGSRTAAIHIASNDADENPFDISLTGTGTAPLVPEIVVTGSGNNIADGATSTSTTNLTDFGGAAITGGSVDRTFTIGNSGTAALTLSGSPIVSVSGTHAADFSVTAQPGSSIAVSGTTTFTVHFDPSGAGTRSATLSFANNDGDENPFNFSIVGTGVASSNADLSNLTISTGTLVPGFASGTTSYTVDVAHAVSSLTVTPTVAQVNASVTVNGNAVTSGNASGSIALAVGANTITTVVTAQNGSTQTYTIIATREPGVPEIAVEQPVNTDLVDGTASIDFGSVPASSSGTPVTFTIKSVDTGDVVLGTITKDGTNPGDFAISAPLTSTVTSGGSTTFTVTFTPGATGARTAVLHIPSNDANENPFDIILTGTGAASNNANLSALVVTTATLTPSFAAGTTTYTASVPYATNSVTVTPTAASATASGITVNTTAVVSGNASGPVALNVGDTTITTVVTAEDGTTTKTYTVTVTRAAPEPEIVVEQPANTNLVDGSASVSFGSVVMGSPAASLTFTVRNSGNANLTLGAITKDGTHASDFTVSAPAATVGGGSATAFVVTFTPGAAGARSAAIHIPSNDADETPFDIVLTGTGTLSGNADLSALALSTGTLTPVFASGTTTYTANVIHTTTSLTVTPTVAQANSTVTVNGGAVTSGTASSPVTLNYGPNVITTVVTAQDGVTTKSYTVTVTRADAPAPEIAVAQPAGSDLTDGAVSAVAFGTFPAGVASSPPVTFTVSNSGTGDLTLGALTFDGPGAADFTASAPVNTRVIPGGSTTFTVTFTPSTQGVRTAALHIASDDANENPFDINLSGSGTPAISLGAATYEIFETAGPVNITVVRTGSAVGAVSVTIASANGSARAPLDFTALTSQVLNFADGEVSKTIAIPIIADALNSEINETFTVSLSSPTGVVLGSVTTATVVISEPDTTIPTVSITTPFANSKMPEGALEVTGRANDDSGLSKVEISVNGGAFVDADLTLINPATRLFGTWTALITPVNGSNTISVRSTDLRNNVSTVATRTFIYAVMRPLTLTLDTAAGGSVTITPPLVNGDAQLGETYTLKATANSGYIWHEWTAPGVTGAAATATTLNVVMVQGLAITASFVTNSFVAGSYNGLAQATGSTTPGQDNLGLFSGTVGASGSFSGKVNFAGTSTSFTTAFDKITGNASGSVSGLSYDLHLDLTGGTDKITGTVTQTATGDVSAVDADRTPFSAAAKVPDQFLKPGDNTKNGTYTVVFPSQPSQLGLTNEEYPLGDGFGTVTVTPVGLATLVGTLADGTAVTASAPLSKVYAWPLAAFIKSTATITGLTMGGMVQFDATQADSDLSATDLEWYRPARAGAANYVAGWPSGILINAVGAHYDSTVTAQASLGLGAASPTNGKIVLADGGLTEDITKTSFRIVGNVVTKVVDPTVVDASYTLAVVTSSGAFNGTFTPNWTNAIATKPTFKGIMIQKGASKGGYGFFLNNGTGADNLKAGGVTLSAP